MFKLSCYTFHKNVAVSTVVYYPESCWLICELKQDAIQSTLFQKILYFRICWNHIYIFILCNNYAAHSHSWWLFYISAQDVYRYASYYCYLFIFMLSADYTSTVH